MGYQFLSDEWVEAARAIRAEYKGKGGAVPHVMRMNLNVTDVPGRADALLAYMDTTQGELDLEVGQLENPDLTVTLDHETAKAILVEGNAQAGMQAFMSGKIKVVGDMTKLMAMQSAAPDPVQVEVQQRLKAITD